MSDYDREEWNDYREERRPARRGYRDKKVQTPIRCVYRMQHTPKTPTVHGVGVPKLGEIVSTKEYGPAKVVEVFWRSNWHVDICLRRIETEKMTVPQKLAVKDAVRDATKKTSKPALKSPQKKPYVKKDTKR